MGIGGIGRIAAIGVEPYLKGERKESEGLGSNWVVVEGPKEERGRI